MSRQRKSKPHRPLPEGADYGFANGLTGAVFLKRMADGVPTLYGGTGMLIDPGPPMRVISPGGIGVCCELAEGDVILHMVAGGSPWAGERLWRKARWGNPYGGPGRHVCVRLEWRPDNGVADCDIRRILESNARVLGGWIGWMGPNPMAYLARRPSLRSTLAGELRARAELARLGGEAPTPIPGMDAVEAYLELEGGR